MGTLAEMRHLSALTVEATFDGTVPDLSWYLGSAQWRLMARWCVARSVDRSSRW